MKKTLVVYDSMYGNTEKTAQAIADALRAEAAVEAKRVTEVAPDALASVGLLIVGSPTQGFNATRATMQLMKRLGAGGLKGIKAAAFDTRLEIAKLKSGTLRLLVKTGGYAAPRIGTALKRAGAILVLPPEGFLVEDTEGPLKVGELERAAAWAKHVWKASSTGGNDL